MCLTSLILIFLVDKMEKVICEQTTTKFNFSLIIYKGTFLGLPVDFKNMCVSAYTLNLILKQHLSAFKKIIATSTHTKRENIHYM